MYNTTLQQTVNINVSRNTTDIYKNAKTVTSLDHSALALKEKQESLLLILFSAVSTCCVDHGVIQAPLQMCCLSVVWEIPSNAPR